MFSREAPDEDDFFSETRMSFGDHIEALRTHLWRAIAGLVVCLVIGFVLDGIGLAFNTNKIGIARPLFVIIEQPVREAINEYNDIQDKKFMEASKKEGTEEWIMSQPMEMKVRLTREDRVHDCSADRRRNAGWRRFCFA